MAADNSQGLSMGPATVLGLSPSGPFVFLPMNRLLGERNTVFLGTDDNDPDHRAVTLLDN
jgi:hypothetical protein